MKKQFFLVPVFSLIVALPIAAKAQTYTLQPSVSSSLGSAVGAALSGNYNSPTTTMYFGNNASMYRNNQVYGGPDYVASFYGQNNNNYQQSENAQNQKNQQLEQQSKDQAQNTPALVDAKRELEKVKKEHDEANKTDKDKQKEKQAQLAAIQQQEKSSSPYIDNSVPLSVVGKAKALDGISMRVGSTLVILHGIIAPGNGQMCNGDGVQYDCGDKATENLGELVNGKTVACTGWGNYGICVSQSDGTNINNYVLGQGIAKPE